MPTFRSIGYPNENPPIGLHTSMFMPTLRNQASEEQKAKWLNRSQNYEIIGTYAQTEMGHGKGSTANKTDTYGTKIVPK